MRLEFQKNKFVTDQNIIDVLLFKGKVELDECLKGFKQPTHVMRMLEEKSQKKRGFLEEFYNP